MTKRTVGNEPCECFRGVALTWIRRGKQAWELQNFAVTQEPLRIVIGKDLTHPTVIRKDSECQEDGAWGATALQERGWVVSLCHIQAEDEC